MAVLDPETMQPVPAMVRPWGNHVPWQHYDERLSEESLPPPKLSKTVGFTAAIWRSCIPTATPKSRTAPDIIISGGENISSIEVEDVLYRHPAVMGAAVVARPDEKWGETPCAFVELKEGAEVTEQEIIDFCRERIARYKCPKSVVFGVLPKTSTGKIQKFMLRQQAKLL
jgi:fatty-acyl-CoA synthase